MNDRGRPAAVQRTPAPPRHARRAGRRLAARPRGAAGGPTPVGLRLTAAARATGLAAVLAAGSAGLLAVPAAGAVQGAAPAAVTAAVPGSVRTAGADALQVRRTNAAGNATVDLAVLSSSAARVKVTQGGNDLPADSEPMVTGAHPLGIVVQVRPDELTEAQGMVADALSTLPDDVRVRLVPVAGPGGGSFSSETTDPSTALSRLGELVAEPSAATLSRAGAGLTGAGAARALLVLTTCPGLTVPDVASTGGTSWVLAWGGDCRIAAPPATPARVVAQARDGERALEALPALVRQVVAARSVQVVPKGPEPLTVTAGGERATVSLDAPAADQAAGSRAVGPATLLALGGLGAVVVLLAVLLAARLRRRRPAPVAPPVPTSADTAWMRLVPDWNGLQARPGWPESSDPQWVPAPRGGEPAADVGPMRSAAEPARPDLVIDLRHPAEARREAPEGSA